MSDGAKLALARTGIEKNGPPELLEAFDVWMHFRAADEAGMSVEWFQTFIDELKGGCDPRIAGWRACYEWDC
jgi:hypothetical protein